MKLFRKIFISLLFLEIFIIIIYNILFRQSSMYYIYHFISILIKYFSYPLYLFDKSYPYYANSSIAFSFFLIFINTSLQTIFIYLLIKYFSSKTKKI